MEDLTALLYNATCYMFEQGMNQEEIAEYLGTTVDILYKLGIYVDC